MPTIMISGIYRLFFFSGDRDEPPHVHVEHEDRLAKFWLDPVRLQRSTGFNRFELTGIEKVVNRHKTRLLEAWNEYFGT